MKRIVELTSILSRGLAELEERAIEENGYSELTASQKHYIEMIGMLGNPNVSELASALRLSKPTVTVGIDRLIDKGYIVKVPSDNDRRNTHLHLTNKGAGFNNMHNYAHRKFAEIVAETFSAEEQITLQNLLEKLCNNL